MSQTFYTADEHLASEQSPDVSVAPDPTDLFARVFAMAFDRAETREQGDDVHAAIRLAAAGCELSVPKLYRRMVDAMTESQDTTPDSTPSR